MERKMNGIMKWTKEGGEGERSQSFIVFFFTLSQIKECSSKSSNGTIYTSTVKITVHESRGRSTQHRGVCT